MCALIWLQICSRWLQICGWFVSKIPCSKIASFFVFDILDIVIFANCRLLFAVCRFLVASCYLLFDVCCLLVGIRYLLFVVYCFVWCLWFVWRSAFGVWCLVFCALCLVFAVARVDGVAVGVDDCVGVVVIILLSVFGPPSPHIGPTWLPKFIPNQSKN